MNNRKATKQPAVWPQRNTEKSVKTINLNGRTVEYILEYKNVKNINLRVKANGSVHVSANCFQSERRIEGFLQSNAESILSSIDKFSMARVNASAITVLSRDQEGKLAEEKILPFVEQYYPVFSRFAHNQPPEIKYRRMKSSWGSCRPTERILTFNTRLAYVPDRCVEYVVVHEYAHFVHANHSRDFYNTVASVLPDWKERRKTIRTYEGLMLSD